MHHSCGERPLLGALLVEQGAIKEDDVELALRTQTATGGRLGKILVELGLLCRTALDTALARQSGVELEEERGFGTGLRAAIERRHRGRRGLRAVRPLSVD